MVFYSQARSIFPAEICRCERYGAGKAVWGCTTQKSGNGMYHSKAAQSKHGLDYNESNPLFLLAHQTNSASQKNT